MAVFDEYNKKASAQAAGQRTTGSTEPFVPLSDEEVRELLRLFEPSEIAHLFRALRTIQAERERNEKLRAALMHIATHPVSVIIHGRADLGLPAQESVQDIAREALK